MKICVDNDNAQIKMVKKVSYNSREKISGFFVFIVFFVCVYFYINRLQQNYASSQSTNARCSSELIAIKYQLEAVTSYKKRLDILLVKAQEEQKSQKATYEDILDSSLTIKQQYVICQSQFEDLQTECKKIKEHYYSLLNKETDAQ